MVTRSCKQCGTEFEVPFPSSKRLNCSAKCRGIKTKTRADKGIPKVDWMDVACPCGVTWKVPPWKKKHSDERNSRFYCSPECNDRFKRRVGGRPPGGNKWVKDGYVTMYVAPADRTWTGTRTSDKEHRIVMRKMLGRDLFPGENVHHKNGNGLDNRPENLELWYDKQPKGQRIEDLLAWAYEIIERYEPLLVDMIDD